MTTSRPALLLALTLALGPLAACSSADPPVAQTAAREAGNDVVRGQAAALQTNPRAGATLNADAFAAAMEVPETVILDVRTPEEFAAGHIEGAVNIDVSGSGFEAALGELDPEVPYAVYCRSGNRSATALAVMEHLGFTAAYHLDGGVGAWTRSGRPLVTP